MEYRWKKHQDDLFKRQHSSKGLQESFEIYGLQEFKFEVLETGIEPTALDERELYWMTIFDSHQHGFNSQTEHDKLVEAVKVWRRILEG
jgi:hypothetical protein